MLVVVVSVDHSGAKALIELDRQPVGLLTGEKQKHGRWERYTYVQYHH